MTRRKPGRPSQGLSEVRQEIRLPRLLAARVRKSAKAQGVSVNEWWRRAAKWRLVVWPDTKT